MGLPRNLLLELGLIGVTWAAIEQHLILSVSALSSQPYGGKPTGDLRSDFRRLRERWWKEVVGVYPAKDVNKVFQPLNMRLAEASKIRGDLAHGTWNVVSRGLYNWEMWEQRKDLVFRSVHFSLAEIRTFREQLEILYDELDVASR